MSSDQTMSYARCFSTSYLGLLENEKHLTLQFAPEVKTGPERVDSRLQCPSGSCSLSAGCSRPSNQHCRLNAGH